MAQISGVASRLWCRYRMSATWAATPAWLTTSRLCPSQASPATIRRSYLKLAKVRVPGSQATVVADCLPADHTNPFRLQAYHPDRHNGSSAAKQKFQVRRGRLSSALCAATADGLIDISSSAQAHSCIVLGMPMQTIVAAFEVLSDRHKRHLYDLHSHLHQLDVEE